MISFFLFILWVGLSTASFFLGLYYIQDLPLHTEFIDTLHIQLNFPNFGSDANLWIGLFLVLIFPLILFFTWKWYRWLLVHEIRKGFWKYLLLTLLQALSYYILISIIGWLLWIYNSIHPLLKIILYFIFPIYFIFLRISWYQDYHGKKRFFRL